MTGDQLIYFGDGHNVLLKLSPISDCKFFCRAMEEVVRHFVAQHQKARSCGGHLRKRLLVAVLPGPEDSAMTAFLKKTATYRWLRDCCFGAIQMSINRLMRLREGGQALSPHRTRGEEGRHHLSCLNQGFEDLKLYGSLYKDVLTADEREHLWNVVPYVLYCLGLVDTWLATVGVQAGWHTKFSSIIKEDWKFTKDAFWRRGDEEPTITEYDTAYDENSESQVIDMRSFCPEEDCMVEYSWAFDVVEDDVWGAFREEDELHLADLTEYRPQRGHNAQQEQQVHDDSTFGRPPSNPQTSGRGGFADQMRRIGRDSSGWSRGFGYSGSFKRAAVASRHN